ncbi:hypothetical protein EYE42_12995 [Paracoccus subflavus]|uniref:GST N-terminal domain-containing protein n=1 Tax=Paracoccus subflavus TaxID=2528244 RepID=A0A4Q9FXD9_9RHOB|nr:glutathione S-transferase N-terminal domain-containing protein [Paracoccus subflavus]TBN38339.1 hypothetical protein EYE42_12995 [Paracoccus subflavus]
MKLLKNTTSPFARLAHAMLIEAGAAPEVELVNPWADPEALTEANPARRVPALILDDGTILTEAMLIARHATAISPQGSHLRDDDPAKLAIAGLGFGTIEAAVYIMTGRKIVSNDLAVTDFDRHPVADRRRGAMRDSLTRIEAQADRLSHDRMGLAELIVADAIQYLDFRFPGADWRPAIPRLDAWLRDAMAQPSVRDTVPT